MSGKAIAVDMGDPISQLEITPPDVGGAMVIQIASQPSQFVKAEGQNVWVSPLQFAITGYQDGMSIDLPTGAGGGSITATCKFVKAEGKLVMLEGDTSETITLSGSHTSPTGPRPASAQVTVRIKAAGQTSVLAQ